MGYLKPVEFDIIKFLIIKFLLHYSLSCIFTSLGRMGGALSALAYRKDTFFQSVKERLAESNDKSCLHDFVNCRGETVFN